MTGDAAAARVGLVVVSHSSKIADGVVELAAQMAGDVVIAAAGGTDDGRIGTSFDLVTAALEKADAGSGVVLLADLGSAVLTAETALDFVDDDTRERVRIADAPLVEGAVAAAVAAQSGGDLAVVLEAAESARGQSILSAGDASVVRPDGDDGVDSDDGAAAGRARRTVTLINPQGLHARPASLFANAAASFDATVTVNGVNAKSVLAVMAMGADTGAQLVLEAEGPEAQAALDALEALVADGFGE